MAPVLVVRGLSKWYLAGAGRSWARVRVLHGVSFVMRRAERLLLVGRRGSGKTTLLHCLAGLRHPDGGEVRWLADDRPVSERWRALHETPASLCAAAPALALIDADAGHGRGDAWHSALASPDLRHCGWLIATADPAPFHGLCHRTLVLRDGQLHSSPTQRLARRVAEGIAPSCRMFR